MLPPTFPAVQKNARIDWIEVTLRGKSLQGIHALPRQAISLMDGAREFAPQHGYTRGMKHPLGFDVQWGSNRDDMGTHVRITGQGITNLFGSDALSVREYFLFCLENNAKFSRVDFAYDVIGIKFPDMLDTYLYIRDKVKKLGVLKNVTMKLVLENDFKQSEEGAGIYVGARSSDRMTRIYDKGAESGQGVPWYRVECVLKNDYALKGVQYVCEKQIAFLHRIHQVAVERMRELGDWSARSNLTHLFASDDKIKWSNPVKPLSNTEQWLLNAVCPAIEKYTSEAPDDTVIQEIIKSLYTNIGYAKFDRLFKEATYGMDDPSDGDALGNYKRGLSG